MSYRSLVILIVVAGIGAMAARPSFDGDTWWHLRAGEWILEHRQIPTTDPFSHTMQGAPWAYPGWLAQLALVGSYRVAGLAGLSLFTALFVGLALIVVWRLLAGPVILRAAVALLAAAASAVYWSARPQILTFLLAAVFVWTLERHRSTGVGAALWLLPPAMALWTNLHGGFAIGLVLILMYLAAELIETGRSSSWRPDRFRGVWLSRRGRVAALAGIFGLCLAATALNPHGPAIVLYPFKTVAIPVLQAHIQEWMPPDLSQPGLLPFVALAIASGAALVTGWRRAQAIEWIGVLGWGALAMLAVRNVPIFALVAAPVVSRHASHAFAVAGGSGGEPASPVRRWAHGAAGAAVVAAALSWSVMQLSPESSRSHLKATIPLEAIQFIGSARPPGRLFNDYNWGGYVLWALYPDYPSFVDGRTDVFSAQVFDDYLRIWTADAGALQALDRYAIGVVLVPSQAPAAAALQGEDWLVGFRDDQAVVLLRAASP